MKRYNGSLLDESSKFAIMNQIEYSQKVGIPWGMSEAAFNLKDLQGNYQYKAFGIPWLGLKRGLEDDIVISSYGTILAISDVPNEVVQNLKILEKEGMKGKYGFYESIDYTPERLEKGKKSEPVKTYMAHHQALILLSLNNYFNNQIFQKRFSQNAEIEAVNILLQERMPETFIITKENKQKPEKIKYKDYENYSVRQYNKIDNRIIRGNLIGNEKYTIAINQNGEGVSKFGDNYINRYKRTADYPQGIFICVKDVKNNEIEYMTGNKNCNKYVINFAPDKSQFEKEKNQLKSRLSIITDANEPVEIRRVELENLSQEEKILEVVCYFEPVLSRKEQDYAHQAFNNLFLVYGYDEENDYETSDVENEEETEERGFFKRNKVVPMPQAQQVKMVITQPTSFEQSEEICGYLKEKKSVIINLEYVNKDVARRIIDFVAGAVNALDGHMQKISNAIFLVAPINYDIASDLAREELKNKVSVSWLRNN